MILRLWNIFRAAQLVSRMHFHCSLKEEPTVRWFVLSARVQQSQPPNIYAPQATSTHAAKPNGGRQLLLSAAAQVVIMQF
jgi:hypothetical protein